MKTDAIEKINKFFANRTNVFFSCTVLILVGVVVYLSIELCTIKKNPNILVERETSALIKKIGAHIMLPEGEVPTIATVRDPEALKDQEFFSGAKKGDKVLFYRDAKIAVLYDVVADRVITVAPLVDDPSAPNLDPINLDGVSGQ